MFVFFEFVFDMKILYSKVFHLFILDLIIFNTIKQKKYCNIYHISNYIIYFQSVFNAIELIAFKVIFLLFIKICFATKKNFMKKVTIFVRKRASVVQKFEIEIRRFMYFPSQCFDLDNQVWSCEEDLLVLAKQHQTTNLIMQVLGLISCTCTKT